MQILFDEEVEEGNDIGESRFYCRDMHAPVLLVLDEGFKVRTLDLFQISLA